MRSGNAGIPRQANNTVSAPQQSQAQLFQLLPISNLPTPNSQKGNSVVIPTSTEGASQVHPLQQHLIATTEPFAKYLPERGKNPFGRAPLVLWPATANPQAELQAAKKIAYLVGSGQQVSMAVADGFNPQEPQTYIPAGVTPMAASQTVFQLSQTLQMAALPKEYEKAQKQQATLSHRAFVEQVAAQNPGLRGNEAICEAFLAYVLSSQPYPERTLPQGVHPEFMEQFARGYRHDRPAETFVAIGSDEEKALHNSLFCDAAFAAGSPQDQQNIAFIKQVGSPLFTKDEDLVNRIAQFSRTHGLKLPGLFDGVKDSNTQARKAISRQLYAAAKQAKIVEQQKALGKLYLFACNGKKHLNDVARQDALAALNHDGIVTPNNWLKPDDVDRLLAAVPTFYRLQGQNTNVIHIAKRIVLRKQHLHDDLAAKLSDCLKVIPGVNADPQAAWHAGETGRIKVMLDIDGSFFELSITLNPVAASHPMAYKPHLSLRSMVAGANNEFWNRQFCQVIVTALTQAATTHHLQLAQGASVRQSVAAAETSLHTSVDPSTAPLIMIAEWLRDGANPDSEMAKALAITDAPRGYTEDELAKLRLAAIKSLADEQHSRRLYLQGNNIYSGNMSEVQRQQSFKKRKQDKQESIGIQAQYHTISVDGEQTSNNFKRIRPGYQSEIIENNDAGQYVMRCTGENNESVFIDRTPAADNDGVRYRLKNFKSKDKEKQKRYLKQYLIPMILAEHRQGLAAMANPKDYNDGLVFEIAKHDFDIEDEELAALFFEHQDSFAKIIFTGCQPKKEFKNQRYRNNQTSTNPAGDAVDMPQLSLSEADTIIINTHDERLQMIGQYMPGIQCHPVAAEQAHSVVYCLLQGIAEHRLLVDAALKNAMELPEVKQYIEAQNGDPAFTRFYQLLQSLDIHSLSILCSYRENDLPNAERESLYAALMGLQVVNGRQQNAYTTLDQIQFNAADVTYHGHVERVTGLGGYSPNTEWRRFCPYTQVQDVLGGNFVQDHHTDLSEQQTREAIDILRRNQAAFDNAIAANQQFDNHMPSRTSRVTRQITATASNALARVTTPIRNRLPAARDLPGAQYAMQGYDMMQQMTTLAQLRYNEVPAPARMLFNRVGMGMMAGALQMVGSTWYSSQWWQQTGLRFAAGLGTSIAVPALVVAKPGLQGFLSLMVIQQAEIALFALTPAGYYVALSAVAGLAAAKYFNKLPTRLTTGRLPQLVGNSMNTLFNQRVMGMAFAGLGLLKQAPQALWFILRAAGIAFSDQPRFIRAAVNHAAIAYDASTGYLQLAAEGLGGLYQDLSTNVAAPAVAQLSYMLTLLMQYGDTIWQMLPAMQAGNLSQYANASLAFNNFQETCAIDMGSAESIPWMLTKMALAAVVVVPLIMKVAPHIQTIPGVQRLDDALQAGIVGMRALPSNVYHQALGVWDVVRGNPGNSALAISALAGLTAVVATAPVSASLVTATACVKMLQERRSPSRSEVVALTALILYSLSGFATSATAGVALPALAASSSTSSVVLPVATALAVGFTSAALPIAVASSLLLAPLAYAYREQLGLSQLDIFGEQLEPAGLRIVELSEEEAKGLETIKTKSIVEEFDSNRYYQEASASEDTECASSRPSWLMTGLNLSQQDEHDLHETMSPLGAFLGSLMSLFKTSDADDDYPSNNDVNSYDARY